MIPGPAAPGPEADPVSQHPGAAQLGHQLPGSRQDLLGDALVGSPAPRPFVVRAADDDVVVAIFPRSMPTAEIARRVRTQLDG